MGWTEDLEQIALQERELAFANFDETTAWELGMSLRQIAVERGLPVVIDVRRFGQPLFYSALAGTTPDNVEWVRRKNNVVARFHRSSYAVGLKLKMKGETLQEQSGLSDAYYAVHGGAFPIRVNGAGIIGSVTVSGLPQRADHELVVEALCGLLGQDHELLRLAAEV